MIQEPQIILCPSELPLALDLTRGLYCGELQLTNLTNQSQYLTVNSEWIQIVSTFHKFMRQTTNIACLNPGQVALLSFTVQRYKVIRNTHEKILIFFATVPRPLLNPSLCDQHTVHLKFSGQFGPLDEEYWGVMEAQAKECIERGKLENKSGRIKEALQQFSQAFEFTRLVEQSLMNMAESRAIQGNWEEALIDIETALLLAPQNIVYLTAKAVILIDSFIGRATNDNKIPQICAQIVVKVECNQLSEDTLTKIRYAKQKIEYLWEISKQSKIQRLKSHLIDRALESFKLESEIGNFYQRKSEFEDEMREALKVHEGGVEETPDYVLDPISYEIMQNPVILPSGNSFESQSLKIYFSSNGIKDPFSRVPIQQGWIVPNNSLAEFIKENERLQHWKRFEEDILRG